MSARAPDAQELPPSSSAEALPVSQHSVTNCHRQLRLNHTVQVGFFAACPTKELPRDGWRSTNKWCERGSRCRDAGTQRRIKHFSPRVAECGELSLSPTRTLG